MRSTTFWLLLLSLVVFLVGSTVSAQEEEQPDKPMIRVGYYDTMGDPNFAENIELALNVTGDKVKVVHFPFVRNKDDRLPTPEFYADLDAVIVAGDPIMADPVQLGHDTAKFLESGRCVIVVFFALRGLEGDWKKYRCLAPIGSGNRGEMNSLRLSMETFEMYDYAHPIMQGVKNFTATYKSPNMHIHQKNKRRCRMHAMYNDTTSPLVVSSDSPPARRVELNFFPVSDALKGSIFYEHGGDGEKLLRNAVSWCVQGNTNQQGQDSETSTGSSETEKEEL